LDLVVGSNNNTLSNLVNAAKEQKTLWKRIYMFVGYKYVSDAIHFVKALNRTKDVVGTEQTRQVLESFLHHRLQPECELESKAGTRSNSADV
jgi:hypothetical protein